MKFRPIAGLLYIYFALIMSGCRSDSTDNPRAYVEGQLVSATVDFNKFRLKIISNDIVTAQTALQAGGFFTLSGPISNDGFSLTSTEKIKSFKAEKSGLTISADSMQINVPKGITYLKFNEIVLTK